MAFLALLSEWSLVLISSPSHTLTTLQPPLHMSDSVIPWIAASQASLSITNSWNLL